MNLFLKPQKYPNAIDVAKVGSYPAKVKAGGGYFYDDVLEYRVWINFIGKGAAYWAFPSYEEAIKFRDGARSGKYPIAADEGAPIQNVEEPLVLVQQLEWIEEPEPGKFFHRKNLEPRIAEWQVAWLKDRKGTKEKIPAFLQSH